MANTLTPVTVLIVTVKSAIDSMQIKLLKGTITTHRDLVNSNEY